MAVAARPTFGEEPALERGVPADVHVMYRSRPTPQRKIVQRYHDRVWASLAAGGVLRGLADAIRGAVTGTSVRGPRDDGAGPFETVCAIPWRGLLRGHWVGMLRMKAPFPELLVVFADETPRAPASASELTAALREAARIYGAAVELTEWDAPDGRGRLTMLARPDGPLAVVVGQVGPLLLIGNSKELADSYLSLFGDPGAADRLVEAARFTEALARLPEPADSLAYADVHGLVDGFEGLVARLGGLVESAQVDPAAAELVAAVGAMLRRADVVDVYASVKRTEGTTVRRESCLSLLPDAKDSPFGAAVFGQRPFQRVDRFVPKEAKGYRLGTGADWETLYGEFLDFVQHEMADAQGTHREWSQHAIRNDLLAWLSGEYAVVALPSTKPSAFLGGGAYVVLLRVRDVEHAARKIESAIRRLRAEAEERGGPPPTRKRADVGKDGFFQVSVPVPMLGMMIEPIYGFWEDFLVVGTSPEAVRKVLATASGKAPTVAAGRWADVLGPLPDGPIMAAGAMDLRGLGRNLGRPLGLADWLTALAIGQDAGAATGLSLQKLGPVLHAVNFLEYAGSVTVRRGDLLIKKSVVVYRKPSTGAAARDATTSRAAED